MKPLHTHVLTVTVGLTIAIGLAGCTKVPLESDTILDGQGAVLPIDDEYIVDQADFVNGEELVKNLALTELSRDEKLGIVLMREEEKLARDVYTTLGATWGINIFSNIAASEQTHLDAMGTLLTKYSIEDPVKSDTIGAFTSTELLALYTQLVNQGSRSLAEALQVSAAIEDLDIFDLQRLIAQTDKPDIIAVYSNLLRGSQNHLRAFTKQIERNGAVYVPEYISQSEYDSIISTAQERGNGHQGGNNRK